MLQGIQPQDVSNPQLNNLLKQIGRSAWGLLPKVATDSATITVDTLPEGYAQLFNDGTNRRIFYNINSSIVSLATDGSATSLSIAGQAQGDILYFNGTSWVSLPAGTDGQYLETNGAGANPSWSSVTTTRSQLFTSSGTFTAPSGVSQVFVTLVGGGGGGAGNAGGGGGGGAYAIKAMLPVTPTTGYSVTVGAGGAGGAAGVDGTDGTASVFNADVSLDITANGGSKGLIAGGAGGAGGTASADSVITTIAGRDGHAAAGGADGGGSIAGIGGQYGVQADGYGYGSGGAGGVPANAGGAGKDGFVLVEW